MARPWPVTKTAYRISTGCGTATRRAAYAAGFSLLGAALAAGLVGAIAGAALAGCDRCRRQGPGPRRVWVPITEARITDSLVVRHRTIAAIERTMCPVRPASDALVVEPANGWRGQECVDRALVDSAIRIPSLFQVDDHEAFRRVITYLTNEAASRGIGALKP
jgi:hypothetical protein